MHTGTVAVTGLITGGPCDGQVGFRDGIFGLGCGTIPKNEISVQLLSFLASYGHAL